MNGLLWNMIIKESYKDVMFTLLDVQLDEAGISYQWYAQDEERLDYVCLLQLVDEQQLLSFISSKTYSFIEQLCAKLCSFQTITLCAL